MSKGELVIQLVKIVFGVYFTYVSWKVVGLLELIVYGR